MNGFTCPRCGGREWGEATRANGERAHVCHGIIRDEQGRAIKSCDFEMPAGATPPRRTREEREAALVKLIKDTEATALALARVDLDDELTLREFECAFGQRQSDVVLLIDDAVNVRQDRERAAAREASRG